MGFDTYTDLAPFNNLMGNLAVVLWDYQRHLLENPDMDDPWWFLVDLNAPRPERTPDGD